METIYDFSNPNTEYIYSLHPKSKIILHIKRESSSTAALYFTNQLNTKIDIPSEFILLYNKRKQRKRPNEKNEFPLKWEKDYDVVYNGETLFNIRNVKTPSVYNTAIPNEWIIYN